MGTITQRECKDGGMGLCCPDPDHEGEAVYQESQPFDRK